MTHSDLDFDEDVPILCLFCDDMQLVECEECDGNGTIQTGEDASIFKFCEECKGEGEVKCQKCTN